MKKFKEYLQEKVTREFGGIYEPNGIKDIKTYENPNINITGMATYDLKNMTNLITAKLSELTREAKMLIVKKLNSVKSIGTFIKTSNGFKVSNPEGYVAIDRVSGNAVKLVDRMEFSFNNFTAAKAWDK